ncbi:adenylate/guanylate cyclase domain-containing protein [Roseibium sp. HPY-6]|uniref:CHASE2 domain-containing protein n=1 Tax=Roseibium sp. HPY-6 TaxID=3229852 RepID=UPI0033906E26
MKSTVPRWIVALAFVSGLAWSGYLAQRHLAGTASVLDRFETVLLDLRIILTGERKAPKNVTIVAIDDQTVSIVGKYPLTRSQLAELVGKIEAAGAQALAIDILLFGASDSAGDAALAKQFKALPVVIAAAGHSGNMSSSASFVPTVASILPPTPEIADAAEVGLANVVTDTGGTPRHIPLLFLTDAGLQPSFSLKALELYSNKTPIITESGLRTGNRDQVLDAGWHLALNYYGPGGTIRTVSAERLLTDKAPDLTGQIVVLGVTATGVGDRFGTPFDPVLPGAEVQATGIANLLDGTALARNDIIRLADGTAAIAITVLGLVAVAFLPLAPASVFYIFLLACWLLAGFLLFGQSQWLNGALPFAASLPPVVGLLVTRQIFDRFHSRRLMQAQTALSRFQSPRLADRIAEDPDFLAHPREQDAAMLFIDLSGYTGLSEQLGPVKTRDFLKTFHTIVVDVADKTGGAVLDFMGDGAMLGFGVPDASQTDPVNAVRCAFQLESTISGWLGNSNAATHISAVRVGAHFGKVVLSRLGHDRQQQITTTGDCVNVASRLLEIAKGHDASIAFSVDLLDAVASRSGNRMPTPRLETVSIRGRQQDLQVALWRTGEFPAVPVRVSGYS